MQPRTAFRRGHILFVVLALALLLLPSVALPETSGYEWPTRTIPFTVTLDSHLTDPSLLAALDKAATSWSSSSVLDVTVGGSSNQHIDVYQVDDPNLGPAWTELGYDNGKITSASIYVNSDVLEWSTWWKEVAICHEVGHGLGLDHQSDPVEASCIAPGWPSTVPNARDFETLEVMYGDASLPPSDGSQDEPKDNQGKSDEPKENQGKSDGKRPTRP
jgi:hypothetical protein